MKLTRARLVKGADLAEALMPARPQLQRRLAQHLQAKEVATALRVAERLAQAEREAEAITAHAEREAAQARLGAEARARADAAASFAAQAIALRTREDQAAERQLDQAIALARLLAERLLGEALDLEPKLVVSLARQALNEARGARQVVIEAHPDDAVELEGALESLAPHAASMRIVSDAHRARGNLRIVTELGALDAALGPQLERLAAKLRESLKP